MKITVSIIWIIFVALFIYLGISHWSISKKSTPPFKLTERPGKDWGSIQILGADADQILKDFAEDFNSYLDEQNESARKQNRNTAYGYGLAALTALFSFLLVWIHEIFDVFRAINSALRPGVFLQ